MFCNPLITNANFGEKHGLAVGIGFFGDFLL